MSAAGAILSKSRSGSSETFQKSARAAHNRAVENIVEQTSVIPELIAALWANPQLAEAFENRKKGWEKLAAHQTGIEEASLSRAVKTLGVAAVLELAKENPAGAAPAVSRTSAGYRHDVMAESMHCQTSVGCQSTGCPTTVGCQSSMGCPTNLCVVQKIPALALMPK